MDTKFFVSRRKARGLSQAVLCEGICTQSTLSKFENNTQVPSLPILRQLCERLDLSIDDLDEERRRSDWLRHQLDWTEEELMVENYQRAKQLLAAIPTAEITSTTAKMQYSYLQGLLVTLVGAADTPPPCSPSPGFLMSWTKNIKRSLPNWPTWARGSSTLGGEP